MLLAVVAPGAILGEIELSSNPADWQEIPGGVSNAKPLEIPVTQAGYAQLLLIWETLGTFYRPMPMHFGTPSLAVGDTVVLPRGEILIEHAVAERFIVRGFYE